MPKGPNGGKYIETPKKMWELFTAYQENVKNNPRIKVEYVGKDGLRVETPLVTPLIMEGFECYVADQGLNHTLDHYFSNKEDRYTDYVAICSRIRKAIRADQIGGGMVGQYNASITQRLNNLKEQSEIKTDQNHTMLTNDPMSE